MTRGKWYQTRREIKAERREIVNGRVAFLAVNIPAGERVRYIRPYDGEALVTVNGRGLYVPAAELAGLGG